MEQNKSNIDELIKKSEQLTSLFKELVISSRAEEYKYVVKHEYKMADSNIYSLADNSGNLIKMDKLDRIKSWLRLRTVDEKDVFYI